MGLTKRLIAGVFECVLNCADFDEVFDSFSGSFWFRTQENSVWVHAPDSPFEWMEFRNLDTRIRGLAAMISDAHSDIRQCFGEGADTAFLIFGFGVYFHRRKEYPLALSCYRYLTNNWPSVLPGGALTNLGVILYQMGEREEAAAALRKALKVDDRLAGAWINLGNVLSDLEKHEQAMTAYRRALKIDDKIAATWYNLGNTLFKQNKLEKAVTAYRRVC